MDGGAIGGAAASIVTRVALSALALGAMIWAGLFALPSLRASVVARVADQINAGETFSAAQLDPMLHPDTTWPFAADCLPDMQRGRLRIAARLAELALQTNTDLDEIDRRLDALDGEARHSLACSAYESYAWYALYWARGNRSGFGGRVFDLLQMSYATGAAEGWIAVRRNPQAVLAFHDLPEPLRKAVVEEWRQLVVGRLYEAAATSLTGIADAYRDQFLGLHPVIDTRIWSSFAQFLYVRGSDLELPGAPPPPRRPWR